jgi:hypothetical protein
MKFVLRPLVAALVLLAIASSAEHADARQRAVTKKVTCPASLGIHPEDDHPLGLIFGEAEAKEGQ